MNGDAVVSAVLSPAVLPRQPPAAPLLRRLPMPDGVPIAVHELAPPRVPVALAVLLHGTGMHSQVYLPFARLLAAAGVAVALVDQRGHGASGGEPGQVDHAMQYADDLRHSLHQLAALHALPMFVLAHSGGCAIALKALPALTLPLAGLALLAPTLAHDPLMARRRGGTASRWAARRQGVAARPPRDVADAGQSAMHFHLANFMLARLLGVGRRRPALVCEAAQPGGAPFVYSSLGVMASMIDSTEVPLSAVRCPVLLATGEADVFVNDASAHHALPWMLPPGVPFSAYSYRGADHFTTLFHAVRDLGGWMQAQRQHRGPV